MPSWLLATNTMSSRRRTPRPRRRFTSARILSSEPASRLKLKAITWSGAVIVALLVPACHVADGTTGRITAGSARSCAGAPAFWVQYRPWHHRTRGRGLGAIHHGVPARPGRAGGRPAGTVRGVVVARPARSAARQDVPALPAGRCAFPRKRLVKARTKRLRGNVMRAATKARRIRWTPYPRQMSEFPGLKRRPVRSGRGSARRGHTDRDVRSRDDGAGHPSRRTADRRRLTSQSRPRVSARHSWTRSRNRGCVHGQLRLRART